MHRQSDKAYICEMFDKRKHDDDQVELKVNQAILLKKLDHENLCRLEWIFEDEKRIHFVFQICTGGSLENFIK